MNTQTIQLIFVYNAKKGINHKVFDFLHKSLSPSTYQCELCAITYGHFSIKKEWKSFIESLPVPVAFYYKEDLQEHLPGFAYALPCILLLKEGAPGLLISAKEMKQMDLAQLKARLEEELKDELKKPA